MKLPRRKRRKTKTKKRKKLLNRSQMPHKSRNNPFYKVIKSKTSIHRHKQIKYLDASEPGHSPPNTNSPTTNSRDTLLTKFNSTKCQK